MSNAKRNNLTSERNIGYIRPRRNTTGAIRRALLRLPDTAIVILLLDRRIEVSRDLMDDLLWELCPTRKLCPYRLRMEHGTAIIERRPA
jgi:hypothetical protein